jgi:hypothetical protein
MTQLCYQCCRPFGLIRYRFAFKRFCSKLCVEQYKNEAERHLIRVQEWTNFLARKKSP